MNPLKKFKIKKLLNDLLKINWQGFKLYLVGGVLEGWETKDIDICILGEPNNKQLFNSMEEARALGPFDLYYTKILKTGRSHPTTFAKSYDRGNPRAIQRKGEWIDGLFWQTRKFEKKGTYTKEPLLIYDGTL
tara:strand:- start:1449 stop:1847 length:399 start_codon:yes stop_codon:yes gene_type:complete